MSEVPSQSQPGTGTTCLPATAPLTARSRFWPFMTAPAAAQRGRDQGHSCAVARAARRQAQARGKRRKARRRRRPQRTTGLARRRRRTLLPLRHAQGEHGYPGRAQRCRPAPTLLLSSFKAQLTSGTREGVQSSPCRRDAQAHLRAVRGRLPGLRRHTWRRLS